MVQPDFFAAIRRRIRSEVLLHGPQATILDRGAPLDDEGDRGGPTLGRLLEVVSHERARCLWGVLVVRDIAIPEAHRVKSEWSYFKSPARITALRLREAARFCPTVTEQPVATEPGIQVPRGSSPGRYHTNTKP
jgi:hypothetical protein